MVNKKRFQLYANKNPLKIHRMIQRQKSATSAISTLRVGNKIFSGDHICDEFYESLANLKDPDMSHIESSAPFHETLRDYNCIMNLVKSGEAIPAIELHQSNDIIHHVFTIMVTKSPTSKFGLLLPPLLT